MTTADQAAVRILLSKASPAKKQAQLTSLARQLSDIAQNRVGCPHCGSRGPHEDNGCRGRDLAFLCKDCGEQWDAEEV